MGSNLFSVDEGVTYVKLHNYDVQCRDLIKKFERKYLSRWEKVPGNTYGSYKYEISHRFGTFTPDEKEYRMAKKFLTDFKEFLGLMNINTEGINNNILPTIKPAECRFDWLEEEVLPRDKEQEDYCDFILNEDKNLVVINASPGKGKALVNETPVQTPTGWTAIGDLKVGDEVIAQDGTVTVVTGVYPQGTIPVNKVVFWDGREVYACNDHLWRVHDARYNEWETLTTEKIRLKLLARQDVISIPLVTPYGDIESRQNELDTYIDHKTFTFKTTEFEKAKYVQQLAFSLGKIAHLDTVKNEYIVSLRWNKRGQMLPIRNIVPVGEAECTCISVDHPDKLFVVNNYVVTHNTIMTVIAFVKMGYRVILTVLPRYVPIWVTTFKEKLKLKSEDVLNVGEHDINELYQAFLNNTINPKIIFFQLTRIDSYLKRMAEYPDDIPPLDKFIEAMRPGVRVVDEAHESIYSVYSSLMYGNLKKTIALSATLQGDDDFVNKIYNGIFPFSAYLKPPTYDKYMEVVTYYHRMNINKYRIRTEGFGGYQHTLYENSILRNKYVFNRYYEMIKEAFEIKYLENKLPEQKAMFFFATVEMCNRFGERLMKDFPNLDIFVFTGEISKKKGMATAYREHDIVITTPGSCGTGKDIPKLYIVFSGVSVSSRQRIDQMTGRLRDISKWWSDLDPIYLTFVCRDIRKQVQYDWKKRQVVKRKTKRFVDLDSGFYI